MTKPPKRPTKRQQAAKAVAVADAPRPEIAPFLDAVSNGVSIRDALAQVGLAWGTVRYWLAQDEVFAGQYERARAGLADWWADRAGDILDDAESNVSPADASAYVAVQKARSEYARWRAGVADRKRYGDKQTIEQDTTLRVVVEYAEPERKPTQTPIGDGTWTSE